MFINIDPTRSPIIECCPSGDSPNGLFVKFVDNIDGEKDQILFGDTGVHVIHETHPTREVGFLQLIHNRTIADKLCAKGCLEAGLHNHIMTGGFETAVSSGPDGYAPIECCFSYPLLFRSIAVSVVPKTGIYNAIITMTIIKLIRNGQAGSLWGAANKIEY